MYEIMPISPDLRRLVMEGASSDRIADCAYEEGMQTLREDGIEKVKNGVTTIEELMRETASM